MAEDDFFMKLWVLLPAYNESSSLPLLLPRIDEACTEYGLDWAAIVLDDGSTDDTWDMLTSLKNEYPLVALRHPINRGLGETERDLFEYVAVHAEREDVALRLDCDDTHDPRYFLGMVNALNDRYDVVVASRFQKGGSQDGVHGYRLFLTVAASLYMRLLFPIKKLKDYSCGFRAYRAGILKDAVTVFGNNFIQMKGLGFTSTLETIVKLNLLGARFCEVPFHLFYSRKASPSKMLSSITTLGYMVMTILHWYPFGGWRSCYKGLAASYKVSPATALEQYRKGTRKLPLFSSIGGGGS